MRMNQVLFKSMQKNIKKYQNIQTKPKYSNKTKVSKVCKSMQKYLYGKKKIVVYTGRHEHKFYDHDIPIP